MKKSEDVDQLEKLMGQLKAIHHEVSQLAKKSPSDAVNKFKLGMVNKTLNFGNTVLGDNYKPIDGFKEFNEDDVPSNSDVTFVVAQYLEEAERYRSDNVIRKPNGVYAYDLPESEGLVRAAPPSWSRK